MERVYETMLIVRPDLSDEEREEVVKRIVKKIESLEGKILNSRVWAKERNLCFLLKSSGAEKKKYGKGCYWLINFNLNTDKLPDLKETIRLEERVLRSIIIKTEGFISPQVVINK